jgi:hypothetical protein
MPIIRAPRQVVAISVELLEDKRISFGAKGLMAFIEAQPDDYQIDAGTIAMQFRDAYAPGGLVQVREIALGLLDELLAVGYLEQV